MNENGVNTTPILDLALRSIRGNFSQKLTRSGDSVTKFEAKLRSLGVIDLYQTAGEDFMLLQYRAAVDTVVDAAIEAFAPWLEEVDLGHPVPAADPGPPASALEAALDAALAERGARRPARGPRGVLGGRGRWGA